MVPLGARAVFMVYCMWFFGFRGYGWPRRIYRLDPLDIARARYARGEISKNEYEGIKEALTIPSGMDGREVE